MQRAICLSVALAVGLAARGAAQPGVHLTDGDAIFDYAWPAGLPGVSNGPAGNIPMNFQLGGSWLAPNTNWMPSGNWFYRFSSDNRERQLTNAGSLVLTGSNSVEYVVPTLYTGGASPVVVPDATAHMHFTVLDTGVDRARLTTEFCIENTGTTPLTVDLFCVLDIDILATPLGDAYGPLTITSDRLWTASDGVGVAQMLGHNATSAGVGDFATIMANMLDTNADTFPDLNGLIGFPPTADAWAVMQYHEIVPPFTTVCAPVVVDIELVPEPSAALLLVAGVLLARARRHCL